MDGVEKVQHANVQNSLQHSRWLRTETRAHTKKLRVREQFPFIFSGQTQKNYMYNVLKQTWPIASCTSNPNNNRARII